MTVTPMELNVQSLIGALILAGILWIAKSVSEQGKTLAILKTILMGSDGSSGVDAEVQNLRVSQHKQGDDIHAVMGNHELLKQRVDAIERRHYKRRSVDREEERET